MTYLQGLSAEGSDLFKARLLALTLLPQCAAHPPACPWGDGDLAPLINFFEPSLWLMNMNC